MALHGRDEDLGLIEDTLASARAGRGRALFFTGEAGIGKSTLIAEARTRASGMTVLAGAAWESGGAPPYWPWQQVLRDAADRFGADRVPRIAADEQAGPDPAAARFALLDAVARALVALSAEQPLLVVLDDLHAADLPTLDLLVHVTRELPRSGIALVAAWREGELAVRQDAAQRLARASRHGVVRPLRRLTADEVARWVGADAARIHATSEGNPLFVAEMLRTKQQYVRHGAIEYVLHDHVALLSDDARELLAIGSVLGRELDENLLVHLSSRDRDAVVAALRAAEHVGVIEKRPDGWAFRHVLLRDHLYDALPPSRAAQLHRKAGELLKLSPVRAAHHLLAGDGDMQHAVATARVAAKRASDVYAFEDAAQLLATALHALERTPNASIEQMIDLRLEVAEAHHRVGASERARAECVRAAEAARAINDVERLARAALVYAQELLTGRRDSTMESLLEQARTALPAGDSTLRARVTARFAASLVPTTNVENGTRAQVLSNEALAMARRLGDDETTMYVLRFVAHAQSFQIHIRDALAISLEAIELSNRVGRPLDVLDHRTFLYSAYLALGDRANADASADAVIALLDTLPQPHYRWRIPVLRASRALLAGQLEEAERQLAIVRALADEYELDRARFAAVFGTLSRFAARPDRELGEALLPELRKVLSVAAGFTDGVPAYVIALLGRTDEARALLGRHTFPPALVVLQYACETVALLGDRALAEYALPVLIDQAEKYPMVPGTSSSVMMRPAQSVLGELFALCGRTDEAIAACERGLALARAIDARVFIAPCEASLARVRGGSISTSAAQGTLSIHDRVLHWNGRAIKAPPSKGLDYLATLIASPGTEIHVSDLVGDDDRGDAGEVLDARARAEYKQRATELQTELDAARAGNDLGRIERLTAELEAITDELVGATGLGGRARKAGSRVERARVNVQRRLKDAIRRLASEDEALGRYLEATVRTGTFCSFVPI